MNTWVCIADNFGGQKVGRGRELAVGNGTTNIYNSLATLNLEHTTLNPKWIVKNLLKSHLHSTNDQTGVLEVVRYT
jgi:hypothetical protein